MRKETFALFAQDRTETAQALRECNARTARYQLTLSEAEIGMLLGAREDALQASGRVELGESILPRLALALCDSPYIQQADYAQTLCAMQALFYRCKTESGGTFTDSALVRLLCRTFNGPAQGFLDYLEQAAMEIARAARHGSVRAVFPVAAEEK